MYPIKDTFINKLYLHLCIITVFPPPVCQAWWHGSIVLLPLLGLNNARVSGPRLMFSINVWKTDRVLQLPTLFLNLSLCSQANEISISWSVFQYLPYENTWETSVKHFLCWSLQVMLDDESWRRVFDLFLYVGSEEKSAKLWCLKSFAKNLCGHNRSLTILKPIAFSRASTTAK